MGSEPRFDGKGFLVAGGAAGAAETVARVLARRGAEVVLCAPGDHEAVGEHHHVYSFAGDSWDEAEIDRLCDATMERLAALNGAVIIVPAEVAPPLAGLSLQEWNAVVVNPLRGSFLLSRRVVEEFLASQIVGRIVLVAGWPSRGPAAAASRDVIHVALYALARTVAKEYGRRGITCNVVVAPSPEAASEVRDVEGETPGLRPADAAVIDAICFLASDEASFVNGEALVLSAAGEMTRPPASDR